MQQWQQHSQSASLWNLFAATGWAEAAAAWAGQAIHDTKHLNSDQAAPGYPFMPIEVAEANANWADKG